MRLPSALTVVAAAISLTTACTSAQDGAETKADSTTAISLDVNDVSYLFPFPRQATSLANYLTLASAGDKGPLLDAALLREALQFVDEGEAIKTVTPAMMLPSNWTNTAMRFDPCVRDQPKASACRPELRLSFQLVEPSEINPKIVRVADQAIHLVFALTPAEMRTFTAAIAAMKTTATTGAALGEHPVIAVQGMAGAVGTAVRAQIQRFAGPSRLRDIALTTFHGNTDIWRFAKASVTDGALNFLDIPCVGAKKQSVTRELSSVVGQPGDVRLAPRSTCADNANRVDFSVTDNRPDAERARSFARIDNPHSTTFNSTDCVSCHKATRLATEAGLSAGKPDAFTPAAGATSAFKVGFLDERLDHFRAFGWVDDGAANVSLVRFTLHDSLEVVRKLRAP